MTSGQKKREDKRFHGAFTGGFSAGYFNSVGSKEGWTPSTFQSSRTQPQASSEGGGAPKPRTQRIEDFMDEEDDPLLGRRLGLNAQFDPLAPNAESQQQFQAKQAATASIPGFIVDDFIQPSRSTIGTTLLGKMGWKPGQGVGPKVRKRKFTSRFSGNDAASTADPGDGDTILIAPKHTLNIADIFPPPKLDKYGVGYDPFVNAPEFGFLQRRRQLEASHAASGGPPRARLTFAASIRADNTAASSMSLGLSALEEADDDLDVYAMDSKDSFDRVLAKQPSRAMLMAPAVDEGDEEDESAMSQVCSDGSSVLTGFRLSATRSKPASVLVAHVVVPPNWRPSLQHLKLAPPRKQTAQSAADRGRALGEVAQPPKPEPERQLLHTQFRAGMMAAISSRFQASSTSTTDDSNAAAPPRQVMEPLARRTKAWMPDRLLCKRFRLSVPDAAVRDAPPAAKPTPNLRFENDIMAHVPVGAGVAPSTTDANAAAAVLPDLPPLERPTLDLFQAVFDDEDDEVEDDDSSSSSEEEVEAPAPPPPSQRADQARADPPPSKVSIKPTDESKRKHEDSSSSDSDRRRKKKHKSKKDHKPKKDRKKHKKHHRS